MRLFKPTYRDKKTGEQREVTKWWIETRDHREIVRRFPAFADKGHSHVFALQIKKLIELRMANQQPDADLSRWLERVPPKLTERFVQIGLLDSSRAAGGRTLKHLLADFLQHLRAKERTPKYVGENESMLMRIFEGCRFVAFSDIAPGKVERYLKGLRDDGLSVRRSDGLLTAMKGFCRWMLDTGQATENPVRSLRKLNEKADARRQRRAATPDELRRLLAATITEPERFGMSGAERALLYRFCSETGLRANEVRTLRAGAFDLDVLTVTVKAGYSKHRETDTIPRRPELAAALRDHLSDKLPTAKVFGGRYKRLTDKTADMLKADLEVAGIAYEDERGALDFHGLRHTFITGLRHAPSRVAQKLARRESSAMTDRYTHVRLHDERAALEMLPDLSTPETQCQRATGTDGKNVTTPFDLAENLAFSGAGKCTQPQASAEENPAGAITNGVHSEAEGTRTLNLRIDSPNRGFVSVCE